MKANVPAVPVREAVPCFELERLGFAKRGRMLEARLPATRKLSCIIVSVTLLASVACNSGVVRDAYSAGTGQQQSVGKLTRFLLLLYCGIQQLLLGFGQKPGRA